MAKEDFIGVVMFMRVALRMVSLKVIKKLLLLCLLASTPSFGAETYACFETGVKDPEPKKLSIDGSFVVGPWMLGEFDVHSENDFCNVSRTIFSSEDGLVSASCFNRNELKLFQTVTLLGGFKNDDDDSSRTENTTWRCISVD